MVVYDGFQDVLFSVDSDRITSVDDNRVTIASPDDKQSITINYNPGPRDKDMDYPAKQQYIATMVSLAKFGVNTKIDFRA